MRCNAPMKSSWAQGMGNTMLHRALANGDDTSHSNFMYIK
jgi:hypothetical protein